MSGNYFTITDLNYVYALEAHELFIKMNHHLLEYNTLCKSQYERTAEFHLQKYTESRKNYEQHCTKYNIPILTPDVEILFRWQFNPRQYFND